MKGQTKVRRLWLVIAITVISLISTVCFIGCGEHEHVFTTDTVLPTCVEGGYTQYICSSCGYKYYDNYVDATGVHTFASYTYNNGTATCGTDGTESAKCEYCDIISTRSSADHPATGEHVYDGYICEGCDEYAPNAPITQGLEYYEINDGGNVVAYAVSGIGDATGTEILIPKKYNDKPVIFINNAFGGCSSLTSIVIPNSITGISNRAFNGCSGLTSIKIPNSVTSIGNGSFADCSNLTSITVAVGNTKYHSSGNCIIETESKTLVAGCKNSVIPVNGNVTSIWNNAFEGCSGLTSIEIPNSVTRISDSAFNGCSGLTSMEIPNSVTRIGNNVFVGCSNLTSIAVAAGNTKYHSAGNCIIETEIKTLIAGCKTSIIPDDGSVTSIGNNAFAGCSSLTSIAIPSSVTSIEYQAFSSSGLTSIEIPNSVTSIGKGAFYGCNGLTSIEIPSSVTNIESNTFQHCVHLTSIKIPDNITEIGEYSLYGCRKLSRINFNGTMAQWRAIDKGSYWNESTNDYTVVCTDGTLSKNEE